MYFYMTRYFYQYYIHLAARHTQEIMFVLATTIKYKDYGTSFVVNEALSVKT